MISFIQSAIEELEKVTWPTREETLRLSGYVVGISLIVALFVAASDFVIQQLLVNIT